MNELAKAIANNYELTITAILLVFILAFFAWILRD